MPSQSYLPPEPLIRYLNLEESGFESSSTPPHSATTTQPSTSTSELIGRATPSTQHGQSPISIDITSSRIPFSTNLPSHATPRQPLQPIDILNLHPSTQHTINSLCVSSPPITPRKSRFRQSLESSTEPSRPLSPIPRSSNPAMKSLIWPVETSYHPRRYRFHHSTFGLPIIGGITWEETMNHEFQKLEERETRKRERAELWRNRRTRVGWGCKKEGEGAEKGKGMGKRELGTREDGEGEMEWEEVDADEVKGEGQTGNEMLGAWVEEKDIWKYGRWGMVKGFWNGGR